jgi:hypothetical protein
MLFATAATVAGATSDGWLRAIAMPYGQAIGRPSLTCPPSPKRALA